MRRGRVGRASSGDCLAGRIVPTTAPVSHRPTRRQRSALTIADVARAAGVSAMTVSRVINGESNVRPATRDAVNAAVLVSSSVRATVPVAQLLVGLTVVAE